MECKCCLVSTGSHGSLSAHLIFGIGQSTQTHLNSKSNFTVSSRVDPKVVGGSFFFNNYSSRAGLHVQLLQLQFYKIHFYCPSRVHLIVTQLPYKTFSLYVLPQFIYVDLYILLIDPMQVFLRTLLQHVEWTEVVSEPTLHSF